MSTIYDFTTHKHIRDWLVADSKQAMNLYQAFIAFNMAPMEREDIPYKLFISRFDKELRQRAGQFHVNMTTMLEGDMVRSRVGYIDMRVAQLQSTHPVTNQLAASLLSMSICFGSLTPLDTTVDDQPYEFVPLTVQQSRRIPTLIHGFVNALAVPVKNVTIAYPG